MNTKLPYIFLCGFPKSGTTTLADLLKSTNELDYGIEKEPNYYCKDIIPDYVSAKTRCDYQLNFLETSDLKILFDASISLIYSQLGLMRVKDAVKDPKFIVVVRNPLELAISFHSFLYSIGHEDTADFEVALELINSRKNGEYIPAASKVPFYLDYINCMKVGSHISYLKGLFGDHAVHILSFDRLISDQKNTVNEVLNFLGVAVEYKGKKIWSNETLQVKKDLFHIVFLWALNMKSKLGISKGFGLSRLYFLIRKRLKNLESNDRAPNPKISRTKLIKNNSTCEMLMEVCNRELDLLLDDMDQETVDTWRERSENLLKA